ncbi:hypothetical protein ABTF53_19705, partial [Acinetobacter baumannii]
IRDGSLGAGVWFVVPDHLPLSAKQINTDPDEERERPDFPNGEFQMDGDWKRCSRHANTTQYPRKHGVALTGF